MPQATKVIKRRATRPIASDGGPRPEERSAFVEVVTSPPDAGVERHAETGTIEVVLRTGRTLRLSGRVDAEVVVRLVTALEAC